MAEKNLNIRIRTIDKELKDSLKKIAELEKTVDRLSKKPVKIKTSAAQKRMEQLRKEIEKGNEIAAKLFNPFRTDGFGRSIGKVRDQLSQVRAAFDAANSAADRQNKATALLAGNFKKIRMEAVAFAMASGDKKALNPGATGANVKARLKEIEAFPKTMLAGREAMGLLNRMLELAEVNSKDFLDISQAIGKQLKINADIQKASDTAAGIAKPKKKVKDKKEELKTDEKINDQLEQRLRMEMDLFNVRKRRLRQQKQEEKQSDRQRAKQRQGRLLGAGFPLLFGGGVGSVAGSVIGSLGAKPGEEFGAQIFGSAIGTQLEQLVRRANALGDAIDQISFDKLEEQSIIISGELRAQVNILKELGRQDEARAILAREVEKRTGASADVTRDVNRQVQLLNAGFSELVNSAGTTLSIVGGPLLTGIGTISFLVAELFKTFNRGVSTLRSLIPDLPVVDEFFERFNKRLQEALGKAKELKRELRLEGDAAFTKFTIEQQKTIGKAAQTFEAQKQNLLLQKRIVAIDNRRALAGALAGEENEGVRAEIERNFADKLKVDLFKIDNQLLLIDEKEQSRNEKLQRRINLITQESQIQSKITAALNTGDEQTARRLQFELEKVRIQNQLGEELRTAKSVEEEILLVKKAIANIDAARIRINSQLTQQELKLKSVYEGIGSAIENGIVSAIDGAIQGTKTLGDVARSVFGEISRQLISFGVNTLLTSIFPGSRFFRANGGPVSTGKSYMVGERGPEMFTPNTGGRITPNSDLAGGSTNIVVNVDASGSSVEGDEQQGRELGRLISVAVQSEILQQKRPGGLLA